MAILYRVREGSGEGAVASSEVVDLADIAARFPAVKTKYLSRMPLIGKSSANAVSEAVAVVVQVVADDELIWPFGKQGWFLLQDVRPRDLHNLRGSDA